MMTCQDCEKQEENKKKIVRKEKIKAVEIAVQFNSTSAISVFIQDNDSTAKELSEIAKNTLFELVEKFNKQLR